MSTAPLLTERRAPLLNAPAELTPPPDALHPSGGRRFHELDAFRGIAALWVVLFHFLYRYGQLLPQPGGPTPAVPLLTSGTLPVFWFFIISGFVITWTIERSNTVGAFTRSRFSRLYPTYWAALGITFTLGVLNPLPFQHYTVRELLWNTTMVQEYFHVRDIDGAYWSLAVELLFYTYMAVFLRSGLISRLPLIALIWAGASVVAHLAGDLGHDVPWRIQLFGFLQYVHFFAAGIAFYQLWRGRAQKISAAVLILCFASIALTYSLTEVIVCGVCFGLFLLAIRGRLRWIRNPVTLWLGAISYALYVSHEFTGYRLITSLDDYGLPHAVSVMLTMGCVLVLATLLTQCVEQPAMRAIRRVGRRPSHRASCGGSQADHHRKRNGASLVYRLMPMARARHREGSGKFRPGRTKCPVEERTGAA